MRKLKSAMVGGKKFEFGDWNVDKAAEMLAWIMDTLGTSVKPGYQSLKEKGLLDNLLNTDTENLMETFDFDAGVEILHVVIETLFSKLQHNHGEYARRLRSIVDTGDVLVEGKPLNYELEFQGNLKKLHLVAFQVLKAQFSDFFGGAALTSVGSSAASTLDRKSRSTSSSSLDRSI